MNPESSKRKEDNTPIRQQGPRTEVTIHGKLPCLDLVGNIHDYSRICAPLYTASMTGDWEAAQVIFEKYQNLDLVGYAITEGYDTPLHIAACAKSSKSVDKFVENLVTRMTKEQLELKNGTDNTALSLAAAGGNLKTVMTLLEKHPALVNVPGREGMPLYMASVFGRSEMVNFLFDQSPEMDREPWTDSHRSLVLHKCVETNHFDVALKILSRWPRLAVSRSLLEFLAVKTDKLKGTKPHFIWRILYPILEVIHVKVGLSEKPSDAMKLLKIIWANIMEYSNQDEIMDFIVGPVHQPKTSRKEKEDVQQLLEKLPGRLYEVIRGSGHEHKSEQLPDHKSEQPIPRPIKYSYRLLFVAAEMGNTEFLVELIHKYPDLIWKTNDKGQTIFHVAIINRHEGIHNLLNDIGSMKDMMTTIIDEERNNMLHLVGKCAKNYNQLRNDLGVGVQMQRELLWFKEVQDIIPPAYREWKNKDGLTAHELFMEEHKDLVSANEKWMKDTANQCLVVGALIASIAFAAAFGVPGGYDQNTGIPMFVHNRSFIVFTIADAISLAFSSISILIFLSIYLSRYAELDFLQSLPQKLMTGLATLLFSIAAMLVGFSVSFFVIFQDKSIWIPIIIAFFISIPVFLYVKLQYDLFGDVYYSIIGYKQIFKPKYRRALFYQNPRF